MNVADAMTPRSDVVTVEIPGTRDDVLEYLQERSFSSVPVIKQTDDGEEFRGIVSRDALINHPDEDQLALLTEEVPTVTADTSIQAVAALMVEERARRIPVVDGRLEGIITVTDVIRAIATGDVDGATSVDELARRDVNCVYAGTPLTVAERELDYAEVPYGVVLGDEGEMCGMLTEVDIIDVARVVEGEAETGENMASDDDDWKWESVKAVGSRYMPTRNVEIPHEPVRAFMTEDVLTVSKRETARDAAQLMIDAEIEQIPLVSGDDLVGIVRDMDLLEGL
ncbi:MULTISPECIES: CBS domain-containing protein [Halomicrobium]|uniref:CBS domain containing protein n=2 Tax=Halomicrobium mukohataei TaxID=57705 RepID=C7P018_HALMD|nr:MULTISPECIES: CBS domain-containing protein [Halomicrobium]ACV46926.1 CBS domain containing protein [Halomicrobium mukohataei DSM 12286]QCD65422.1 CBS domain-containing protein [Halomicrobium mukohataei]QFR20228.1 CBS domain-containing protein [Halomicrobium sp. ZPS1]